MGARRSVVAALGVVVVAVLVLTACGGDPSTSPRMVSREQVESLLVQRQRERNPRLQVQSATCPDGIVARQGESFECTVLVEGEKAGFTVTISEVLGDRVRYDLRSRQAIVDVAGVVDFVRSRLDEAWRSARIDCGQAKVRLVDVGGAIECTVFDGTTTRYIQAVVEDRDGTFTLRER